MLDLPYDEIVVTGCSYSCGMEMNDHLLSKFGNEDERRIALWKWGMKNLELKSKKIEDLGNGAANSHWLKLERQNSWPALLQKKLNIPVTNLSMIGAPIGHSLITYLKFLKNVDKDKKILTIHQLPNMGRMYIRFDEKHGRIPTPSYVDSKNTFGFAKEHFKEKIDRVHRIYKHRVMSEGYLEKYYWKLLNRLHTLSTKKQIKNFYIFPGANSTPISDSFECNILLKDFTDFRSNYPKGKFRHPIGPAFNTDMCKIIMSTCF